MSKELQDRTKKFSLSIIDLVERMDDTIKEKTVALKIQYQPSLTELINLYGLLSRKAFKGEFIAQTNPSSSLNHVKSS